MLTETNNMNTEEMLTNPETVYEKPKEKPVYGRAECVVSALVFLFAVLFMRFVVFNITGIISSLLYIAIITTAIVYLRKKEYAFSGFNKALTVVLYVFSLVFSITDNGFIKFLDCLFLFGAGAYLVFSVCSGRDSIDRYLPYALKRSVLEHPFAEFRTQSAILSDSAKDSSTSTNIKRMLLGLFLTIPVTVIVAQLLMQADDGVDRLLTGFFDSFFTDEMWIFLVQVLMAIPCSFYLFGMFYSNIYRRKVGDLTAAECDGKLRQKRTISNLIFYSAAAPVLILYVIFFISQASYFLSAFMGRLPEEFSYAEYARKGFFELCWIVVINLGIMIIMNLHSTNSGEEKSAALKIYNVIFCVFTLILIATALSKMVMYIDAYGLTKLRVYTTWFMVLCAFIFLLVLIKQFNPQLYIAKWISVGFTLMFAILCFSRPEACIVKYNHAMNKLSVVEEIYMSDLRDMSDDGMLAAVNEGVLTLEQAQGYNYHGNHATDNLNISTLILENK
ncbi:MAG: DUF4173 domain-containing protein [Ruminococcus sp.]|nr:DUF4173 domain-containing protein [Ruminococcus sp.]